MSYTALNFKLIQSGYILVLIRQKISYLHENFHRLYFCIIYKVRCFWSPNKSVSFKTKRTRNLKFFLEFFIAVFSVKLWYVESRALFLPPSIFFAKYREQSVQEIFYFYQLQVAQFSADQRFWAPWVSDPKALSTATKKVGICPKRAFRFG